MVVRRPRWDSLHNILWSVLSFCSFRFMRFEEYAFLDGDRTVALAQVVHRLPMLAFMEDPRGIHIGPCRTDEAYRGRGLYPTLLRRILHDYRDRTCYIFCSESNAASLRGIEKAGFKPYAKGHRTRFGRYVIDERL